jgi:TonB family protein
MKPRAALISLALHFFGALLLFLTASFVSPPPKSGIPQNTQLLLRAPRLTSAKPGGGSGERSPLPANKGRAPEVHVHKIFIAPTLIRNENPKLIVEQAALTAPDINISMAEIGDPLGQGSARSNGKGGPHGIGDYLGGGPGYYGGPGGPGNGQGNVKVERARVTRQPQVIYKVEPEYSEEARKMKYQGSVLLAIDVDVNGQAINIRVIRQAGLGLDERAIEAVHQWRFRPALSGDKPVVAPATVEVSFHLL